MTRLLPSKGFTLIEVLMYILASSILLFAISSVFSMLYEHRAALYAETRVDASGENALRVMLDALRRADSVVSPQNQEISDTLILSMEYSSLNPTVFERSGNSITMREGDSDVVYLTASDVEINSLLFQNLSNTDDSSSIRIELAADYAKNSDRTLTDFSHTFYASVTTQ
jgi:Tfp pilus assembly protein PilW